jgi:rare lipoprotein A
MVALALLLSACGHKPIAARVPAAPPVAANPQPEPSGKPAEQNDAEAAQFKNAQPILVEEGLASWYGPPYHNRRGANGQVYDMRAATAAHRTLPMNSVVRVVNVETGAATIVRITDRGPFIPGRVIDLSLTAAKAIGVWGPGVAQVRVEVLETPAPIDRGGRWCVQIGAFNRVKDSDKLKAKLAQRYRSAKVLEFAGPTGEWIRVRVLNDEKARAESVIKENRVSGEAAAFLVRLD